MRASIVVASLLTVIAATGCKKKGKSGSPPVAAAPAAPAPAPPAPEAEPEGAEAMRTLGGRLAYEAAHRPTGTATVEDVLAALARAGVDVAEPRQYIAMTAAASYCAGGRTRDNLAVSVCEYGSPALAAAGRAHVEQRFGAVPDRVITIRGATTLTLTAAPGVDAAATRDRAIATFAAL